MFAFVDAICLLYLYARQRASEIFNLLHMMIYKTISNFLMALSFSVIADINECEYMQQVCPFGCENTIGSYRCKDASASTPPPEEVEIATTNIVEPYTTEISAPVKTCGAGMTLDASNICIDIDECAEGNTGCEHCENSIGSYGKRSLK